MDEQPPKTDWTRADPFEDEATRRARKEIEYAEAGFYPIGLDGVSVREFVCSSLAGGYEPDHIRRVVIDPLTDRYMTLDRFLEVFKEDVESGGALAIMRANYGLYSIGTKGSEEKNLATKLRALTTFLERRDTQRWAPPNKRIDVNINEQIQRDAAAKEGIDLLKQFVKSLEDAKRSMPLITLEAGK